MLHKHQILPSHFLACSYKAYNGMDGNRELIIHMPEHWDSNNRLHVYHEYPDVILCASLREVWLDIV